jgi:hypothetical protein
MKRRFKVGDHVAWNSEAGRVSGRIIGVHTHNVDYKGHTHQATLMSRNMKSKAIRQTISQCIKDRP